MRVGYLWLRQVGWVLVGLGLVISPWLLRNWQTTGQFVFDDTQSQTRVMLLRYSLEENTNPLDLRQRPDEDLGAYASRVNQGIWSTFLAQPDVSARFVSTHFLNAEISNLFLLPVRDFLISPGELVMPPEPFGKAGPARHLFGRR